MSYEKVLFVGIVVDYRFSEVAHSWKSVRFIAVIEAFDTGSILLANDVSEMNFAGKNIVGLDSFLTTEKLPAPFSLMFGGRLMCHES